MKDEIWICHGVSQSSLRAQRRAPARTVSHRLYHGWKSSPCLDKLLFEQTQPKPQAHPLSLLSQSLPISAARAVIWMGAASVPPPPLPLQIQVRGSKPSLLQLALEKSSSETCSCYLNNGSRIKYLLAPCLFCWYILTETHQHVGIISK